MMYFISVSPFPINYLVISRQRVESREQTRGVQFALVSAASGPYGMTLILDWD